MVLLKLMTAMSIIKTQESEDDEYASAEIKVKHDIVSVHSNHRLTCIISF